MNEIEFVVFINSEIIFKFGSVKKAFLFSSFMPNYWIIPTPIFNAPICWLLLQRIQLAEDLKWYEYRDEGKDVKAESGEHHKWEGSNRWRNGTKSDFVNIKVHYYWNGEGRRDIKCTTQSGIFRESRIFFSFFLDFPIPKLELYARPVPESLQKWPGFWDL